MHRAEPVGGEVITRFTRPLLYFLGLWLLLLLWRYSSGIGPVSGMNDGYPWGIWIAYDVVTGTALACGGYAVAILLYVLNKGKYHPLIRPALLTSALGYSMAGLSVVIDVGRPWNLWKVPVWVGHWNVNSPLLEVALCIMAYVGVLWIELSPAFMEKWAEADKPGLRKFAETGLKVFDKLMIFIVALGILLPTMHQSSLGTVMLLAGHKLHPLWHTPLIPLLFLISCIGMGYAVVVLESSLATRLFGRQREDEMLASLGGAISVTLWLYVVIRIVDLVARGRLGLMFSPGWLTLLFWIEIALFVVPAIMLARSKGDFKTTFRAALIIIFVGGLYRFDAYLVAYNPGPQWSYFPSVAELLITLGVISLEILLYVYIVKRFPILAGVAESAGATKAS